MTPCFAAHRWALLPVAAVACAFCWAQADANPANSSDEPPPPAAPALETAQMVRIEQPAYSAMRVGLDAGSLSMGWPEGVLRYVVLLRGEDGSQSAFYQGLRCSTWEVKTYARYRFDAQTPGWQTLENASWSSLSASPSRYALSIARSGLCNQRAAPVDTNAARRALRALPRWEN